MKHHVWKVAQRRMKKKQVARPMDTTKRANERILKHVYLCKKNIENLSSEIAEYFPNPREDMEIYREQALVTPNTHGQNRISL